LKKKEKLLKNNKGVTMVELIVSFALLAIFLTVVTKCISDVITSYYTQQKLMSMYTVADSVMGELKDEICTMQGSELKGGAGKGYLKLRDADGITVTTADDSGTYTGSCIEFLQSNLKDGAVMMQIDAGGSTAPIIDAESIITTSAEGIEDGHLTMLFYLQYSENNQTYKGLYLDRLCKNTKALADYQAIDQVTMSSGTDVIWDAEERLPDTLYQGYDVKISYSVTPVEATINGETGLLVTSVKVTVSVLEDEKVRYEKSRTIRLENPVRFNTEATTYSDI